MTDEPKLLPCPFCRGEAVHLLKCGGMIAMIACRSCGVETSVHSTRSEAIAAWNTRATPPGMIRLDAPELLAMVDALREATSQLASVTGADDRPESDSWYIVTDARAAITAWENLTK